MGKNKSFSRPEKDNSLYIPQQPKIKEKFIIKERNDFTENQKKIIDLILDKKTKIVFLQGPAGTSKTFLSVYCGLKLLNDKRVSEIDYVRTIVESASKSLGSLPGEADLKFEPFILPLKDKLDELLQKADVHKLLNEQVIKGLPMGFLRGASKNCTYIIADEIQNFNFSEIVTLITRLGHFTKLVCCGDLGQSDINGKTGYKRIIDIFDNEESRNNGIYCISLTKDDVVRSGIVKFILEKLENAAK